MKIVKVIKQESELVYIDDTQWSDYYRYSTGNWAVTMGESIETIFSQSDIDELEKAYQEYQNKHGVVQGVWEKRFKWLLEQHYIESELRFRLGIDDTLNSLDEYTNEVIKKIDGGL